MIAVAPLVALALAALWIATFALFRYTSVASIVAAVALPFVAFAFGYPDVVVALHGARRRGAIVWLHRANLRRLRAGTENRVRLRGAARLT